MDLNGSRCWVIIVNGGDDFIFDGMVIKSGGYLLIRHMVKRDEIFLLNKLIKQGLIYCSIMFINETDQRKLRGLVYSIVYRELRKMVSYGS